MKTKYYTWKSGDVDSYEKNSLRENILDMDYNPERSAIASVREPERQVYDKSRQLIQEKNTAMHVPDSKFMHYSGSNMQRIFSEEGD